MDRQSDPNCSLCLAGSGPHLQLKDALSCSAAEAATAVKILKARYKIYSHQIISSL